MDGYYSINNHKHDNPFHRSHFGHSSSNNVFNTCILQMDSLVFPSISGLEGSHRKEIEQIRYLQPGDMHRFLSDLASSVESEAPSLTITHGVHSIPILLLYSLPATIQSRFIISEDLCPEALPSKSPDLRIRCSSIS